MSEPKFFRLFKDCAPVRPVYYKRRWVALPLLHLDSSVLSLLSREVYESPHQRSCHARNKFCESLGESLVPFQIGLIELAELCRLHNIPLRWVIKPPQDTWTKRISKNPRRLPIESRKNKPAPEEDYKKLLAELKEQDFQVTLICKTLWEVNGGGKLDANKLNGHFDYVALEEILSLQVEDQPKEDSEDAGLLTFPTNYGPYDMSRSRRVSRRLWKALCKHVQGKFLFMFSNEHGGPLLPEHVARYIRLAAKKSGIKNPISSQSLRNYDFKGERISIYIREPFSKHPLDPIDEEERQHLVDQFSALRQEGKGRKSLRDPIDTLNEILSHLVGNSLGKAPIAVKSQYKRWKKSGLLAEISHFRTNSVPMNKICLF